MLRPRSARSTWFVSLICFLVSGFFWMIGEQYETAAVAFISKPFGFSNSLPLGRGRLHLLLPATSRNPELCRLLLSAQILGFPTPTLINFGQAESEDPYVQHLAKVQGVLEYLDKQLAIHQEDDAEDLVLLLDGYDSWIQLRPDVLIKRYYEVCKDADARIVRTYGKDVATTHNMTHNIVFGPDKICWPMDYNRPACWAVPPTTYRQYAFGPQTSDGRCDDLNDPRWLNSGTVLGPLGAMQELFRATLDLIHANHTTDSDQYYFGEIYGMQEYSRLTHNLALLEQRKAVKIGTEVRTEIGPRGTRREPDIAGFRTEYHIVIDGTSRLFQTVGNSKQQLTFSSANNAWYPHVGGPGNPSTPIGLQLPQDIEASRGPFDVLQERPGHGTGGKQRGPASEWGGVDLLYNTGSREVPAVIHFTGEKRLRDVWWKRMWFQSRAIELQQAELGRRSRSVGGGDFAQSIEGRIWGDASVQEVGRLGEGGVELGNGGWLNWPSLCQDFEETVYPASPIEADWFWHPSSPPVMLHRERGDL